MWAVVAEKHASYTRYLLRPAREESNVPKLKISQGLKTELPHEVFFGTPFICMKFFLIKKLEIEKTKITSIKSVLKVVYLGVLVFSNSDFLIIKISQANNWSVI